MEAGDYVVAIEDIIHTYGVKLTRGSNARVLDVMFKAVPKEVVAEEHRNKYNTHPNSEAHLLVPWVKVAVGKRTDWVQGHKLVKYGEHIDLGISAKPILTD
ncbi:MAG TPA: hypothetical protein VFM18_21805 [Methanosarcina sp.]|nr:hypothetical protein [Methanosarcina sp.]